MKITDALKDEHRILRAHLDRLEELLASGAPAADLRAHAKLLAGGLLSHARIEDEVLFPAIEPTLGRDMGPLAVMRAEHAEIDGALGGAAGFEDADRIRATLLHVVEVARQHFVKEDNVLFPTAERILGTPKLEELNAKLIERRAAEPLAGA
jgi:regulator of cell morphogenesis and NO signaling